MSDEDEDYIVEHGIPIPPPRRGREGSKLLKKLRDLSPGESIFEPRRQSQVSATIGNAARRSNRTYTSRKWFEKGVWGTRIWRET